MTRSTLVGYPGSSRVVHGFEPGVLTSRYPLLVNRTRPICCSGSPRSAVRAQTRCGLAYRGAEAASIALPTPKSLPDCARLHAARAGSSVAWRCTRSPTAPPGQGRDPTDRVSGVILIGFGLRLAVERP